MPGSQLEETNASIILALSKMGVYMERDRNALDKLSPQEQNTRLQKAFDRTVENCCIFPMLFSKQELGKDKLVLSSGRLQWTGWRESKLRDLRLAIPQCDGNFFKAWVATLGKHSIWAPMRMGRYSVTSSSKIQGASVRILADVPEMETLIMRWLSFVSEIDLQGPFPGAYWAITNIPAKHNGDNQHMPLPPAFQAVMAVEPIEVIQMRLPVPIDDVTCEEGEVEMAAAGYVGNDDRQAIPIIVVRYSTSLPGLGTKVDVKSLIDYKKISIQSNNDAYLTPAQHSLFSRLLESNSRRLAPSDIKKYQAKIPKALQKSTSISFFSPIYCPSPTVADEIELGRASKLACAVCKEVKGPDVKLFYCSACSGIAYCSPEHQAVDWSSSHKAECRTSKAMKSKKIPAFQRIDPSNSSSRLSTIILPLQWNKMQLAGEDGGQQSYCTWDNPMDRIKPPSKSSAKSQCAKTIYGPDERFLVRARWGGHAPVTEEQRRSGWQGAVQPEHQSMLNFTMSMIHVVDRPYSFSIVMPKKTGVVDGSMYMTGDLPMESVDNTIIFDAMVEVIKKSERDKAEAAYFWAKRKGDCIEIDMVDIPDQSLGW